MIKKIKVLNLYAGIGGNRKLWDTIPGYEFEITAVEFDPKIAAIYKSFFPNDTVIVGDAHQYLIDHYKEYSDGFIWASPPCPTHSQVNHFLNAQGVIRYPDMSLWQEIIFLQYFCKGLYCIENVKSYYDPLIKPQISGRHYFWANFKVPQLKTKATVSKMCGKNQNQNRRELQSDIGRFGPVKSNGGKRTEGNRDDSLGFGAPKNTHKKGAVNRLAQTSNDIDLTISLDNIGAGVRWGISGGSKSLSRKVLNNCCHPDIGLAILESAMGIKKENSYKTGELFAAQNDDDLILW
jgi:DNA (cytosine-5)-methyltransferase 1